MILVAILCEPKCRQQALLIIQQNWAPTLVQYNKDSCGKRANIEDHIKMNLRKIGWDGMNWNHLTHGGDHLRDVVNTVTKNQFP
jgi:hypothetical protein